MLGILSKNAMFPMTFTKTSISDVALHWLAFNLTDLLQFRTINSLSETGI